MRAGLRETERLHPEAAGIDTRGTGDVLSLLLKSQMRAGASIEAALPGIARAVDLVLKALSSGGRLGYLAAGSPAMIALGDALEIPQTYGEDPARFVTILAGGRDIARDLAGGTEDDRGAARADVAAAAVGPADCVVAISASGSTPYIVEGLAAAKETGAATVAIANNSGAPILQAADVAIFLDTGPEIVCGSTRMAAGTAQKIVLNMISTAVAIGRGHVHDGHMIALRADNEKLRGRAQGIVEEIAGVDGPQARRALEIAGFEVKPAVLVASGVATADEARALLAAQNGHLRPALDGLARTGDAGSRVA